MEVVPQLRALAPSSEAKSSWSVRTMLVERHLVGSRCSRSWSSSRSCGDGRERQWWRWSWVVVGEEGAITGAEARGRGVDRHARTQRREVRIHRREAHARACVCVVSCRAWARLRHGCRAVLADLLAVAAVAIEDAQERLVEAVVVRPAHHAAILVYLRRRLTAWAGSEAVLRVYSDS